MSEELKPCPFCGSTKVILTKRLLFLVRCEDCGAEGHAELTEADAVKVWNRRAEGITYVVPFENEGIRDMVKRIIEKEDNSHLWPNQEIKSDAGKTQLHLVPVQIINDIAQVREYGVSKYGDSESWKEVEIVRYIDALGRHYLEMLKDPLSKDAESGIEHYKHVACNIAFLCELLKVPF